jgi:hypothetical protein
MIEFVIEEISPQWQCSPRGATPDSDRAKKPPLAEPSATRPGN